MLKLEVGKTYETKSGHKAVITHRMPPNPFTGEEDGYPMRGYTEVLVGEISWKENGTYLSDSGSDSDIVREHVPPPTPLEVCKDIRRYWPPGAEYRVSSDLAEILQKADAVIAAAGKAKVGQ